MSASILAGSAWRRRRAAGILYASEAIETASAFSVLVTTPRCLDLTTAPWSDPPGRWTHPHDYAPTQELATRARAAAIAAIRTPSARLAGGINLAVLDPAALVPPPRPHSSWAFLATGDGLLATREMSDQALRFTMENFGIA